MKRITLLVVLLVAVSMTAAFAIEVKPAFTLSGSGTLTWGINLDSPNGTGFTNASSSSLVVTLVPSASSDTHTGKPPIYGSITLSNINLYFVDGVPYAGAQAAIVPTTTITTTGTATAGSLGALVPTVAATFNVDPLVFGIYAAPAMWSDSAAPVQAGQDTGFSNVNALLVAETDLALGTYAKNGTYVKFAPAGAAYSVTADLVSNGDWTANTAQGYAAGLEASFTMAPVTFGAGVFQGFNWGTNPLGLYGKVSVALTGIGSGSVGIDLKNDTGTGLEWELSSSAQMNFNKDATAYLLANISYTPDTNVVKNGTDGSLQLMIPANTMIGAVNFDTTLYYTEIGTPASNLGLVAHAGYTLPLGGDMSVAPTLGLGFTNVGTVNTLKIIPQAVITLTAAPVTTLTIAWTSGDLLLTPSGMGTLTAALAVTY